MITMRKMTDTEFLRFKEYSVTDYAADLVRGERLDKEQALKKAEAEFSKCSKSLVLLGSYHKTSKYLNSELNSFAYILSFGKSFILISFEFFWDFPN